MPTEDRFGCERCWPPSADDAWAARAGLARNTDLVDDSHFIVALLACPSCGQQFVSAFVEEIDWVGGDDPQAWTMLPITNDEARALSQTDEASMPAALNAIGPGRRSLYRAWPTGGAVTVTWQKGIFVPPL